MGSALGTISWSPRKKYCYKPNIYINTDPGMFLPGIGSALLVIEILLWVSSDITKQGCPKKVAWMAPGRDADRSNDQVWFAGWRF